MGSDLRVFVAARGLRVTCVRWRTDGSCDRAYLATTTLDEVVNWRSVLRTVEAEAAPIDIHTGGGILRVAGELDLATAPRLAEALSRAGDGVVCLDLSDVRFVDVVSAHVMVDAAQALGDDGCLIIHGAPALLTKMFEILDVGQLASNLHILDGHHAS
jgi:anti-anti-sigma factor